MVYSSLIDIFGGWNALSMFSNYLFELIVLHQS